jgi:hypothetical protein
MLLYFEHHLKKRLDVEDAELPGNMLLELVMHDVGLEYISESAILVQKYYMRRGLFLRQNVSVQTFAKRVNELNRPYFSPRNRTQSNLTKKKSL